MDRIDHIAIALSRGWGVVERLVSVLSTVIHTGRTPAGSARREALCLLRVAEAIIRRLLILMARQHRPAGPRTAAAPAALPDFSSFAPAAPLARFPLTEPFASFPGPPNTGPRIRSLCFSSNYLGDEAAFRNATKTGIDHALSNKMATRLGVLKDVLAHRSRHARRMGRWLARADAALGLRPARFSPLRPGRPPGYSAARRRKDPLTFGPLMDLNTFAGLSFAPP